MIDSSNLINPFSVVQQKSWQRWGTLSFLCVLFLALLFLMVTSYQLWHMYCLKKQVRVAQRAVNHDVVLQHENLQKQEQHLETKLAKIASWESLSFYAHLMALSHAIPGEVMLTFLEIQQHAIVLKGKAYSIELVLEFLHNLEKTKLLSSMNLQELQPACEGDGEKKLVNFVIKGKLTL